MQKKMREIQLVEKVFKIVPCTCAAFLFIKNSLEFGKLIQRKLFYNIVHIFDQYLQIRP